MRYQIMVHRLDSDADAIYEGTFDANEDTADEIVERSEIIELKSTYEISKTVPAQLGANARALLSAIESSEEKS